MRSSTTYSREKLYEEVWAKPMLEVCKEYGVSDVALAKMCRKLRVPVPGRGHWAKVEAGQTPPRPPLPKLKANERSQIVVSRRLIDRPDEVEIESQPDVSEKVRAFLQKARGIEVVDIPQRVSNPHRLLVEDQRRREKKDWKAFGIDASDALHVRAKRLLQALATELEQLGAKVQPSNEPHLGIFDVVVGDTKVSVRLRETLRQERSKETGLMAAFRDTKVDLVPTGQMEITIEGWFEALPRRRWKDSEAHPLEDALPAVVVGIGLALAMTDTKNAHHRRIHEQHLRAQQAAQEKERLLAIERSMVADLERRAALLVAADRLEVFLRDPRVVEFRSESDVDRAWLVWAKDRVATMTRQAIEGTWTNEAAEFVRNQRIESNNDKIV